MVANDVTQTNSKTGYIYNPDMNQSGFESGLKMRDSLCLRVIRLVTVPDAVVLVQLVMSKSPFI